MEYGLVNKKIAILCAPENALWQALYPDQDITVSRDCKKVLGCGFQTLMNWIRGQPPRKELLNRLCETVNTHDAGVRMTLAMLDDDYDVFEFGKNLGLTPTACEKAIDERLYHNMPLLPGFYFSKEDARIYFSEYNGVYFTYHYSRDQDANIWLARSALRVLYVLRINSHHTLRCKLHVPSLEHGHFFEYNGFLSVRGNHLYWLFEERATSRREFLTIITNKGHPGLRAVNLNGLCTTINQDQFPMPYASRVFFKRVAMDGEWSDAEIHQHMYEGPRSVNDMSEIEAEIRKHIGEAQAFFAFETADAALSDDVDNLIWDISSL
jgi:hypothetical protein